MKIIWLSLFLVLNLSNTYASRPNGSCEEILQKVAKSDAVHDHITMPIVWMASPEYIASCHQAYNTATRNLQNALRRKSLDGKKLAVVLDLDETVLDNTPFQSLLAVSPVNKFEAWNEWLKMEKAGAVPGAREFLTYADSKGVEVFYISNRNDSFSEGTMRNMVKLGMPIKKENLLLRKIPGSSTKEDRRLMLQEQGYEVVLYVGDNLNDFSVIFEDATHEARLDAVELMKKEFGKKFIFLSNPSYGSWEDSLYHYNKNLTPIEKKSILKDNLNPYQQ